jgi:hypothetical protein
MLIEGRARDYCSAVMQARAYLDSAKAAALRNEGWVGRFRLRQKAVCKICAGSIEVNATLTQGICFDQSILPLECCH